MGQFPTTQEETMKYLCMVFYDEKNLNALSATDLQALDDESLAYDETLRRRGHLIAEQDRNRTK